MKKHKTEKGITLIALVITIIVLLILAGVVIATLTGDNGILTNANKSNKSQIESTVREKIELAVQTAKMKAEEKATQGNYLAQNNMENTAKTIGYELNGNKDLISTKNKYQIVESDSTTGKIKIIYGKTTEDGNKEKISGGNTDYANACNYENAVITADIKITGNIFEMIRMLGSERKENNINPCQFVIYEKGDCKVTLEVVKDNGDDIATLTRYTFNVPSGTTIHLENKRIILEDTETIEATKKDEYSHYIDQSFGWYIDDDTEHRYRNEDYTVTKNLKISLYGTYACIAKGSQISMPDGTTKSVEYIKPNDIVLSYDFFNGCISPKRVITVLSGKDFAKVFNVTLENGNNLQIVDCEYVFDCDIKQYIPINISSYESAIGKNIMINNNGEIGYSSIVSITTEEKEIEHYTLYTTTTTNYIANGIVALAPLYYVNSRYNIDENFKVNQEKYQNDIETYGQYSYNDLKDVCTEQTFNDFVLKDSKFFVEKGMITFEKLKNGIKELQNEIDGSLLEFEK